MLHTISADSSVLSDTSLIYFVAFSISTQVKSTFACYTAVFVVAFAVGNFTVVVLLEKWVVTVCAYFADLFFAAKNEVGDAVVIHETVSWFALITNDHVIQGEVSSTVQDSLFALSVFEQESSGTVDAISFLILIETANDGFADTFSIFQEQSNFTDLANTSQWITGPTAWLGSFSLILALAISSKQVAVNTLSACG